MTTLEFVVYDNCYLRGDPRGGGGPRRYTTLGAALVAAKGCLCGGITLSRGMYELRAGNTPMASDYEETSWVIVRPRYAENRWSNLN